VNQKTGVMPRVVLPDTTIKLSATQVDVIRRLQAGEVLHFITGIDAKCFFNKGNVAWVTIYKLEKIGLISRYEKQKKVLLTKRGEFFKIKLIGRRGTASILQPSKDRKYYPSIEMWTKIHLSSEFTANCDISYSDIDYIDFDDACVMLQGGEKVYFDCFSEDQYIHIYNGGFYEEAPDIIESQRI
jgi:hypothetical protein